VTGAAARSGRTLAAGLAAALALAACGGSAPDRNGLIAFARGPGGDGATAALHVLEPGGSARPLTRGAVDRAPAWSPDGSQLAFLRSRGTGRPRAHVVDLEGDVRLLADTPADEVAWSPDGERLLLVDGGTLAVVNADGSGLEVVAESASAIQDASWSPDGSRIVFAGGGGGLYADLYAVEPGRAGTVRLTRLLYEEGSAYAPAWSPDGERIAFLLPGGVFAMNADGSERRRLVRFRGADRASSLAWSPDGGTIAYTLLEVTGPGSGATGPGSGGVFLVSPDGGDPRQLTSRVDVSAAWSPDGRLLGLLGFTGYTG
jgi:Tol biopolymer transport system component